MRWASGRAFGLRVRYSHERTTPGHRRRAAQGAAVLRRRAVPARERRLRVRLRPLAARGAATVASGARATLALKPNPRLPPLPARRHRTGRAAFARSAACRRRARGAVSSLFTGVHVMDPALLDRLPAGPADIVRRPLRAAARRGGALLGVRVAGPWLDLGSPAFYLRSQLRLLAAARAAAARDRSWTPGARAGRGRSAWLARWWERGCRDRASAPASSGRCCGRGPAWGRAPASRGASSPAAADRGGRAVGGQRSCSRARASRCAEGDGPRATIPGFEDPPGDRHHDAFGRRPARRRPHRCPGRELSCASTWPSSEDRGPRSTEITPLFGDASTRRYFRLRKGDDTADRGPLSRALRSPSGCPSSRCARCSRATACPCPGSRARRCRARDRRPRGPRATSPCRRRLREATAREREDLYREALDQLARLQREAHEGPAPRRLLPDRLRHREALLGAALLPEALPGGPARGRPDRRGPRRPSPRASTGSREEIASWPRVLCHRDFHSRNLMRHAGAPLLDRLPGRAPGPRDLRPGLAAARLLRGLSTRSSWRSGPRSSASGRCPARPARSSSGASS